MTQAWRLRLAAAALATATLLCFANGFGSGFVGLDAKESIRDNPNLHALLPLSHSLSLSETTLGDAESKGGTLVRRPLLSFSFALNHVLLGPEPAGFHAVNLVIHILAGLLLFGILRRTLAALPPYRDTSSADVLAGSIALLWLLHPLQTESVTYIVQRAESLMGLCYLATLYAAVRYFGERRLLWLVAAGFACGLGMGTKESMATAPVVVLAYDVLLHSHSLRAAWRRHHRLHLTLAATWLVVVALLWLTADDAAKDFREGRTLTYILSQPGVLLHYVRLALWPDDLHLYVNTYDFSIRLDRSPAWQWILPGSVIATLLGLTVWGCWHTPALSFLGVWFFFILAPTSSFVATSDLIQEHRMYLPLASVLTLVVLGCDHLLRRYLGRQASRIGVALVVVVAVGLGSRTMARNRDYRSELTAIYPPDLQEAYSILVDHELRVRTPSAAAAAAARVLADGASTAEIALAHFTLGHVHERAGQPQQALPHFERVTELQPDLPHGWTQLAAVLLQLDRREAAEVALRRALDAEPDFAAAHLELGVARARVGDLDAARTHLRRALTLQPLYPEAALELGIVERDAGALTESRQAFELALRQRPDFIDAHQELAQVMEELGDDAGATDHRSRATRLIEAQLPTAADPLRLRLRLASLLASSGDPQGAQRQWQAVLELDPELAEAHLGLGALARDANDLQTATFHFGRARQLEPDSADAAAELGSILLERGETEAAAAHLAAAIAADAAHADAIENLGVVRAQQGRYIEAESLLDRALRANPSSARIQRRLAHVRERAAADGAGGPP